MSAAPVTRKRPSATPAAPRARQPKLRVVAPARSRHRLLLASLIMLVAAVAVFATVSLNALAAGTAVATRQVEAQVLEAERRHRELVAEVARLEEPSRVEQAAVTQLGMVPADGARFLVVERPLPGDGVSNDRAAGSAADPLKPVLSAER